MINSTWFKHIYSFNKHTKNNTNIKINIIGFGMLYTSPGSTTTQEMYLTDIAAYLIKTIRAV